MTKPADLLNRLEATFGLPQLPFAPFHEFPNALRFELGGETLAADDPVRFLRAIDRARAITAAAFAGARDLSVVVTVLTTTRPHAAATRSLAALKQCRLDHRRLAYQGTTPHEGAMGLAATRLYRHWYLWDGALGEGDTDRLLWSSIAAEMAISPRGAGAIYFVDWQRRVLAHVYDDRGMDVVAADRARLRPLYEKFRPWLLDQERLTIDAAFEAA